MQDKLEARSYQEMAEKGGLQGIKQGFGSIHDSTRQTNESALRMNAPQRTTPDKAIDQETELMDQVDDD